MTDLAFVDNHRSLSLTPSLQLEKRNDYNYLAKRLTGRSIIICGHSYMQL